jgi:hypothetical protein
MLPLEEEEEQEERFFSLHSLFREILSSCSFFSISFFFFMIFLTICLPLSPWATRALGFFSRATS